MKSIMVLTLILMIPLTGCQRTWSHSLFQGNTGKPEAASAPAPAPDVGEEEREEETPQLF